LCHITEIKKWKKDITFEFTKIYDITSLLFLWSSTQGIVGDGNDG
jgi:hypothetical protein